MFVAKNFLSDLNTYIKFLARLQKVLSSYILTIFMAFFAFAMFASILFGGKIATEEGVIGSYAMRG